MDCQEKKEQLKFLVKTKKEESDSEEEDFNMKDHDSTQAKMIITQYIEVLGQSLHSFWKENNSRLKTALLGKQKKVQHQAAI